MNKHNAKDYLPLVQALAEGKTIQSRAEFSAQCEWRDFKTDIIFNMPANCYRIKPEPRKAWVWWPDLSKGAHRRPHCTTSKSQAEDWVASYGGHILEVAE